MEKSEMTIDDFIEANNILDDAETLFHEKTTHIRAPESMNNSANAQRLYKFCEALTDAEEFELIYSEGETGIPDATYKTNDLAMKLGYKKNGRYFAEFFVITKDGTLHKIKM